jgi:hypothetical protein
VLDKGVILNHEYYGKIYTHCLARQIIIMNVGIRVGYKTPSEKASPMESVAYGGTGPPCHQVDL